ncbi:hypothetical protein Hypma_005607 [Hypsizygus marmoreus]|uniref:BCAS3 WD40 domain-containing protein n=1 Tax=Hypsizygus marmoreus TaxID=39966 RepID=A0A369K410_HYPMA|nr:hypothetical protein Hypma_005607 [Hypsizygus marmoreus]
MPTRSSKNGRSSKSSRHQSPRVNPSPLPAAPGPVATSTPPAVDLLVDFAASDPFGQDVSADQAIVGVFDTFDADAGHSRPENSDEPAVPRSPSPQWNEARSSHTHDTQRFLDQPQPVLAQLNTFNLKTPSPALDLLDSVTADDGDDGDALPIPVPVPRSQGSPVSSPVPTFPPRSPLIEVRSPHSYGYGHVSPRSPPTPASTPSTARPATLARPGPTRFPPPVSTISTTASPSSNRRFAAPLPFTRIEKESVAPPVVDLGTAGRSGGLLNRTGGDAERRERGEARRGDEVVLWTSWDTIKTGSKSRRLLFIGTSTSLQVWDCTLSPSPMEILHVCSSDLLAGEAESGTVVHAAVVPLPRRRTRGTGREGGDREGEEPLVGIAFDTGKFLVYSLRTSCVIRRVDIVDKGSRIKGFEANERFIIVSTTNPPSLHVLSSNSLDILHVIGQDKLLPYLSPPTSAPSTSGSAGGLTTSTAVSMLSSAFAGALSGLTSSSGPAALSHRPAYGEHSAYDEDTIYDDFNGSSTSHTLYNNDTIYNPHHVSLPLPGPRLGTVSPEFDRRRDHVQEHLHPHRPPSEYPHPYPSTHQHQHHHHAHHHESPTHPHAVYALSHRLLAYASTTPSTSIPSTIPPGSHSKQVSMLTSSSPGSTGSRNAVGGLGMGSGVVGLPSTQAELGTAALRVGGSVMSGMRTLGGLAVSAARSRVGGSGVGAGGERSGSGSGNGSGVGRFFSRSAPEGVVTSGAWGCGRDAEERERERERERRYSNSSSSLGTGGTGPAYRHHANPTSEGGYFVTVVDLAPLAGAPLASSPTLVAEFMVSKDKQITRLAFSSDGCTLIVVPRDGHTLQTFQIRPIPPFTPFVDTPNDDNRAKQHSGVGLPARTSPPWHVYNLRRGRTSAVVEGVEWAEDGRWIAIGTRKRTVHVFGVNPYGGKTDQRSHLEGRVRNVDELQLMPTDLSPVVRLRGTAIPVVDQPRVPLSFTFIKSTDSTLPAHLLPQVIGPSAPSVASDASSSPPISPSHCRRRPTNFQDLLLFDPVDGTLSLRRFTVEMRPKEQGLVSSLGATSISLPGMGGTGRLSGSPSTSVGAGHVRSSSKSRSGLAQTLEAPPMEMVAKENTVMTWNLRRRWDGVEVKKGLDGGEGVDDGGRWGRGDWLAQAELSTFSRSPKVLPRPIYLSHQFSFHTFGEDYHALIRRYKFDICGHKIDVHREVQISAYSAGSGESFVEGFSAPRDMRNRTLSSSFDEPLASALAGGLYHPQTSGVLPMLPNGHFGSRPQSFRNAIPIRMTGLGDGMSESLGRIRREINKVRSPRLKPRPDSGMSVSVPLEFDEEDEDFMSRDALDVPRGDGGAVSRDTSRGDDGSGHTVSTPATSAHPLDEDDDAAKGDDAWSGWSSEDKLAIEEAERFDNIDVLGLLDEEQTPVVVSKAVGTKQKRKGRARQRQV